MVTIYKYVLHPDTPCQQIHKGGVILSAHEQFGDICIWVKVDTDQPLENRMFNVYGTGHFISDTDKLVFIDTVVLQDGAFIFHVFEKLTNRGE